jgi:hypothetical protein
VLEAGIQLSDEDRVALEAIGDHLQKELTMSKGITGFCEFKHMLPVTPLLTTTAHGLLPDADDTAKSINTLQLLGRNPDVGPLINNFQSSSVFMTYSGERTPSITTNCNALKVLPSASTSETYTKSIHVAVEFICRSWFSGRFSDKWVCVFDSPRAVSLI